MNAPRHPNTDHDEAYNRAHWHEGEAWLGIESMFQPKRKPPIEIKSGTIYVPPGREYRGGGKGKAR